MRLHILLALCLSFCQIHASPLFGWSFNPIATLQADLLKIINQADVQQQAAKTTSSAAIQTSLSSLQSVASSKWSSLQSLLSTTTSLPPILTTSFTATTAKPTTTSSVKSTSTTANTVSSTAKPSSITSTASSTASSTSKTSSSAVASGTPCAGNTAADRSKWCNYSTSTDYYNEVPDTGVTREYWFNVQDGVASPDGISRYVQTINGSIPGPTIIADWGDNVVVHVTNSLTTNGSSIHFHGIHQKNTNQNDGVPSVTQCPIAYGDTYTYRWRATQYGSSWYHSHVGLQAWEGVTGGIIINGPATANYDEDKGTLMLSDWGHETVDELYQKVQTVGPQSMTTGLINGTNVFGADGASNQTGSRFSTSVQSGKSYRFRLVNSAIDSQFKFSVDSHTMTVMAMDFVPIVPYQTEILNIAIGQRYDVVITANQASVASDFFIRAIPQSSCSENDNSDNIRGVLHYGSSTGLPTTTGYTFTDECVDEPVASLVPYLPKTVSSASKSPEEAVTVAQNSQKLFKWYLNNSTFLSEWEDPTLLMVQNNVTAFGTPDNLVEVPNANEWIYLVIHSALPVPHPIHLHGHDFFVVSQQSTTFDATTAVSTYNLNNPHEET
ncbi:Laccase-2-like protein 4 [Botrytis cinerea]